MKENVYPHENELKSKPTSQLDQLNSAFWK